MHLCWARASTGPCRSRASTGPCRSVPSGPCRTFSDMLGWFCACLQQLKMSHSESVHSMLGYIRVPPPLVSSPLLSIRIHGHHVWHTQTPPPPPKPLAAAASESVASLFRDSLPLDDDPSLQMTEGVFGGKDRRAPAGGILGEALRLNRSYTSLCTVAPCQARQRKPTGILFP
jgi:hypothetical protein